MNSYVEVMVIVEGATEKNFVKEVLSPVMGSQGIFLAATVLGKPGSKGGDVRFSRAKKDIGKHLKQRSDTWVTLLVDYYGIGDDWPGYEESKKQTEHSLKAEIMNQSTAAEVERLFSEHNRNKRFIPYVSMYEIESLYFSDPACLAKNLGVKQGKVDEILKQCGEQPEKINDHKTSAPSKRLKQLSQNFRKKSTGIAIAEEIGIPKMRTACPIFDAWLKRLESLA